MQKHLSLSLLMLMLMPTLTVRLHWVMVIAFRFSPAL